MVCFNMLCSYIDEREREREMKEGKSIALARRREKATTARSGVDCCEVRT